MTYIPHSQGLLIVGLLALCFQSAWAHTYLSSVYVSNQLLPESDNCVRPHPLGGFDSPIPLVSQADMTCGWLPTASQPAKRKCPIAAGSTIGLQWHHTSASPSDDIVDPTHAGPIIVYLAKSDNGQGNVWFKIYEDGYSNGQWGVDRMLAKRGRVDVQLPSDIAPGNYLLRGEILALHGAYALNGVQPYVGCVELSISGSGSANPAGVAIPGFYKNTDPGMLFNRYQPFSTYPIPGPALYRGGSSSSGSIPPSSSSGAATPTTPASRPTSPPSSPNSPPSSGASNIKVSMNSGSSEWWIGVSVSGGGETTVKVELKDSGSLTSWNAMSDMSYAYVFSKSVKVVPPISIKLTSSTGKEVILSNIFTSTSSTGALIDTDKTYASSSSPVSPPSPPTSKPAPPAPTTKSANPTSAPPATGGNTKVNVYPSASTWWFALTITGNSAEISSVEIKDSGALTAYKPMTYNAWAYTYAAENQPLVAPLTIKITTKSGNSATASITSITPGKQFTTSSPL